MSGSGRLYPRRPIVGIGVAVLRPGKVLLARRGTPPNEGAWSLPGGAQKLGETSEEAARRELREETDLTVGDLTLAATVDSIHRDPDGKIRYHYTIIDFAALWTGQPASPGGDITELAWCPFDAFDDFDLWPEARRVVTIAWRLIGNGVG
jgi:8-oxo-dGTP diphosphatase